MTRTIDAPAATMWIGSPLRGAFRLLSYLLLTLALLPIHLLAQALRITPVVRWLPVIYHRMVCVILGIRVRVHGERSTVTPTLYVCNHVSYLDIELLGGLVPGSFVAKAEVATWPFFSTLAKAQGTIFVDRRSSKASTSRDEMLKRLNTGDNLMLFPEGTSSDGTRVLPFRSALFAVAQLRRDDKPITVQPVAISYTRLDGIPLGRYWRPLFAWFGDLDLVPHLWQMVCLGETEAVVTFFPTIDIDRLGDRKKLAEYCFRQVSFGVQSANSGRTELLPPPVSAA
ncbi:MAG: lysophospholipid acyltransferase family protein [Reyranella sp.]|nr:lysophospholipid acyltransferase family protein [Reyranella sp.]